MSATATELATPTVEEAERVAADILQASGAARPTAELVANSLVVAERMGHASHGLVRVLEYRASVANGQIRPGEVPGEASRSGSTAVVDARWGFGHPAAALAARIAADIGGETGVGFVAVRHCNHSGRLGEWVELIAARGLVGVGFLSCGPAVAPYGGLEKVLGTNPLAIAVPTGDRPVVLDFATAAVAEGKIRVAARAGKAVPPGSIQTADGRPSTDPDDFYSGGSILPFGGHKGYALSVAIQLLGEAFTAGGGRPDPGGGAGTDGPRSVMSNGLVLLALAGDPQTFAGYVDECRTRILSSRPADPDAPILLPGDVEAHALAAQPAGRVRVAGKLWEELVRLRPEERSAP
jgi:LDH2 family malate/lactate/ureidoglycolate dehydrogenase